MHWLENISQLQEVKADNGGGQDGELQRRHRRRVASGSESVGELPPKSQIRAELTTASQHSTCSAASAASAASAVSAVSAVALYLLITFYLLPTAGSKELYVTTCLSSASLQQLKVELTVASADLTS